MRRTSSSGKKSDQQRFSPKKESIPDDYLSYNWIESKAPTLRSFGAAHEPFLRSESLSCRCRLYGLLLTSPNREPLNFKKMDPLKRLPPEIILRIIEISPISTIAALTRVTRSWHSFIEETHQEAIYSSPSKTFYPNSRRDLSFITEFQSFARYFEGATSWKDICKRQTLLNRNWDDERPLTRESVIQVGNDAVWRFRVDWKRRLIISTSQRGGLNVTDLDTGNLLWRLPNDEVRPFAHLEYENGLAVFDRAGNGLEVWKTGDHDLPRGTFRRTAILPHACTVRGFQLASKTLCVVSTQGQGFVYDMSTSPPQLRTELEIEKDAAGHLYQDSEVVMYCMGTRGYHIHDKQSGVLLGVLDPNRCQQFYHVYTLMSRSTRQATKSIFSHRYHMRRSSLRQTHREIGSLRSKFETGASKMVCEALDSSWRTMNGELEYCLSL